MKMKKIYMLALGHHTSLFSYVKVSKNNYIFISDNDFIMAKDHFLKKAPSGYFDEMACKH